jgi:hypothetical protein
MSGWLHYLALSARARTGVSSHVIVWSIVAAICSAATLVFFLIAAFVWLADRYGGVTAGVSLGCVFLVLAAIAGIACVMVRHRNMERAKLELAARSSNASWLDPRLLGVGVQVGKAIGWRKLASLAAVAILAAGLSKEWFARDEKPSRAKDERAED